MRDDTLSVAEAARAVDLPTSTIRGWLQRAAIRFGTQRFNRTWRFGLADVRAFALMKVLTSHGFSPNRAASEAAAIVRQAGDKPGAAIASLEAGHGPKVLPAIYLAPLLEEARKVGRDALIAIDLAAIWTEIDARIAALK